MKYNTTLCFIERGELVREASMMPKMKPHPSIKKLDSKEFSIVSLLLTMLPSRWIFSTLCSSVKGQKSASLSLTTANEVGLYNRVYDSGEYKT